MNCRQTTLPNHNHVWLWIQIYWTAWFSAIHSWSKTRKCNQHSTFGPQFLVAQTQIFIDENFCFLGQVHRFRFLNFWVWFLFGKILWMSLRRFNLTMTFFDEPLEGKRWQSSTKAGSIGTSISSKISKTFDSRSLSATLAGISEISRHSLLECYSLA